MGRPMETGRTSRHKCGSKPLESLCVCGLHHAANPWASHGESEEMRQPWAFCSFSPLWSPQTQARLLFSSLPAQLWPLGLQRPPLGPSQEFLPSSGDGLRTHFQPKVDLSPQEEQLWGPNTGTLQILKKRVYTFYIFFDSRASGMELCTQTQLDEGQDNLPGWNTGFPEGGLREAVSHGCIPRVFIPDSLTPQAHEPPRKKPSSHLPTRVVITAVDSWLLREGQKFPKEPVTCWLTTPVWARLRPCCVR